MSKDPAFLFYPSDWSSGTMLMTREQKGAYIDLLMCQFHHGHMTSHEVAQVLGQNDYTTMWEGKLKSKFVQDSEGKFFNERLETEQVRRKNWCNSRNNNKEGKNQYNGHMTGHTGGHMENRNRNRNKTTNTNKKYIKPTIAEVVAYCIQEKLLIDGEHFWHHYEQTNWIKPNGQKVLNWKSTCKVWDRRNIKVTKESDNGKKWNDLN